MARSDKTGPAHGRIKIIYYTIRLRAAATRAYLRVLPALSRCPTLVDGLWAFSFTRAESDYDDSYQPPPSSPVHRCCARRRPLGGPRRGASRADRRQGLRSPPKPAADTDWVGYGNDLASTRYAGLDQIDASNFNNLEVAWRFKTDNFGARKDSYFNATPTVVKGRLYGTVGLGSAIWSAWTPAPGRSSGPTAMTRRAASAPAAAPAGASATGPTARSSGSSTSPAAIS